MSKLNIGDVGFCTAGLRRIDVMGDERVNALRAAKEGRPLPEGWHLAAIPWAGPTRLISPSDVDWSGLREPSPPRRPVWPPPPPVPAAGRGACCSKARVDPTVKCVCAAVTRCPEHGVVHVGTHD